MKTRNYTPPYTEVLGTVLADGEPARIEVGRDHPTNRILNILIVNEQSGSRKHPFETRQVSDFRPIGDRTAEDVASAAMLDYVAASMKEVGPEVAVSSHVRYAATVLGAAGMLPEVGRAGVLPQYVVPEAVPVVAHMALAHYGPDASKFVV